MCLISSNCWSIAWLWFETNNWIDINMPTIRSNPKRTCSIADYNRWNAHSVERRFRFTYHYWDKFWRSRDNEPWYLFDRRLVWILEIPLVVRQEHVQYLRDVMFRRCVPSLTFWLFVLYEIVEMILEEIFSMNDHELMSNVRSNLAQLKYCLNYWDQVYIEQWAFDSRDN